MAAGKKIMIKKREKPAIYGLLAEFEEPEQLAAATRRAKDEGFRRMDAFSPFPVEGIDELIGKNPTRLPLIVLLGGIIGGVTGYLLQYWTAVIDYPLNIGGRPYHSWPSFMPVTFELTILCAALGTVLGMLGLNGLPQPYHPLFNVERFGLASRDRFFLCIEALDPKFDREKTKQFLNSLKPAGVYEVDH